MDNHILREAFLNACLSTRVISIRDGESPPTPLCSPTEIKTHIPTICSTMGIDVENQDVELLLTKNGVLNEGILKSLSTTNRSTLMVAMTAITVRYHRSTGLPCLETVDWIREHCRKIEKQPHHSSCRPHRLFLDWYQLVNANVFVYVPVPETV